MRRDGAAVDIVPGASPSMLASMRPRIRKLIGAIGLIAFVTTYMALAMVVTALLLNDKPGWIQALGYAFAGLIWIVPAGVIVAWMSRTD